MHACDGSGFSGCLAVIRDLSRRWFVQFDRAAYQDPSDTVYAHVLALGAVPSASAQRITDANSLRQFRKKTPLVIRKDYRDFVTNCYPARQAGTK